MEIEPSTMSKVQEGYLAAFSGNHQTFYRGLLVVEPDRVYLPPRVYFISTYLESLWIDTIA